MIKHDPDLFIEYREHMRGGDGTVVIKNLVSPEEMFGAGRVFARMILHPGCSIGVHTHEGESEFFYILKGTAVYTDGDHEVVVKEGDVTVCPADSRHGIANRTDEDVEYIALIIKKPQ
jgi:mannose-6-phosphate isomerase-like protein (cupin superfamily)